MPKQRKYQITPNSINKSEEASVRSVLDKFRNRAVEPGEDAAELVREVVDFPSGPQTRLDSQHDGVDIAKDGLDGYPNSNALDSQTESGDIAGNKKIDVVGLPKTESLDSQTVRAILPNNDALDSQMENVGYPKPESLESQVREVGNPAADNLAIKLETAENNNSGRAKNIAKPKSLDSQKSDETGKWAKYDKARATETVFIRAGADIINDVKHFNIDNGLSMREFFELSATAYIEDFGKPKPGDLARNIALDDRRLKIRFKTEERIINLYETYNRVFSPKTLWSPTDDRLGVVYNEIDLGVIEMGIIECQVNKLESDPECKINSFKYYRQQINRYLDYNGSKILQGMVEIGRKRWRQATGREVDLNFLEEVK